MRLDLPTDPNIEVWRASQANVPTLLREHSQGLRGIVGASDDEFFVWVRSKIDHGQVAEKLGIEIQIRVDFHQDRCSGTLPSAIARHDYSGYRQRGLFFRPPASPRRQSFGRRNQLLNSGVKKSPESSFRAFFIFRFRSFLVHL